MSIYAYTGLPGSGKSYSVVEHQIIPALKSGRRVVTNVALKFDVLRKEFPNAELVEFPSQKVAADPASIYEYVEPGSVLVLDEVWRLFPAGLKANHVPEAFRKLLAEHRHMVNAAGDSCQIVLVTQDLAQISAFARQLVEQTFRTVKLTSVGLSKQYRVDVYNGPATGPNPPESSRIRQIFGSFNSSVWDYYESHTMSVNVDHGKVNERAVDKRANILMRPVMVAGALIGLGAIAYGLAGLAGLRERVESVQADSSSTSSEIVPAAGSALTEPVPVRRGVANDAASARSIVPAGVSAAAVRLVGYVINHDDPTRSFALLLDGKRLLHRPFSYCNFSAGYLSCQFPEFGLLSL